MDILWRVSHILTEPVPYIRIRGYTYIFTVYKTVYTRICCRSVSLAAILLPPWWVIWSFLAGNGISRLWLFDGVPDRQTDGHQTDAWRLL